MCPDHTFNGVQATVYFIIVSMAFCRPRHSFDGFLALSSQVQWFFQTHHGFSGFPLELSTLPRFPVADLITVPATVVIVSTLSQLHYTHHSLKEAAMIIKEA